MKHDTLSKLLAEAQKQKALQNKQILPQPLHAPARFIGNYPWQVLSMAALVSSLIAIYFNIQIHIL